MELELQLISRTKCSFPFSSVCRPFAVFRPLSSVLCLPSSILFGALHGRWLAGTVAGMFYAWAMYRRGKTGDAILAHAITNALIAADVLILGNWTLWN